MKNCIASVIWQFFNVHETVKWSTPNNNKNTTWGMIDDIYDVNNQQ